MRKRYVQQKNGTLVEVGADYVQVREQTGVGALWGDRHYDGLRHTDGTPIDSRTKHRQFMKERNLTTADDFTGTWEKAKKEREDFHTTGGDHKERREQLARALHEVVNRRAR